MNEAQSDHSNKVRSVEKGVEGVENQNRLIISEKETLQPMESE